MAKKKHKGKEGWHLDGTRVYKVKGKRSTRKRTYATKEAALKAQRRKH